MDKPQIIGIGLGGLIGSRIEELLANDFEFIRLSRKTGIDITKPETLTDVKSYKNADFILHLAAKTDVDGCETDKDLGEKGEAWRVNVEGARNVSGIARETGKKVIFFSTDFVFDGEKPEGQSYSETDTPNPINWYAKTKFEGEKAVEESGADYMIIRPAYPYRANFTKLDFARGIRERLQRGQEVKAVTDHIFCPTLIDDIAYALKVLIKNDAAGIYHIVGEEPLSPYEAAVKIAVVFGLDKNLITPVLREEFFENRAPRPFNLNLKNDKIEKLGIKMKGFEEGLHLL